MNWNPDGSICPTCGGEGRKNPRYFAAICRKCEELVTDPKGRPADVTNADLWSGVRVEAGATELSENTPLFVNGIECQAKEARFGGIVIQPKAAWEESKRQRAERRQKRQRTEHQE